jgi:multidrug transporter EmrE-like cation transporter
MTVVTFAIILASVMLNSAAQLALKAGANAIGTVAVDSSAGLVSAALGAAVQPWIICGLVFYFVSAGLWIAALTRVDITVAYPMLSMGYVIAAVAAWHLFGEQLTTMRLLGIGVILVGVVILTRA